MGASREAPRMMPTWDGQHDHGQDDKNGEDDYFDSDDDDDIGG